MICIFFFLETIRQMKPFSSQNLPNIEIEKPLKNWFAQASNRIKKLSAKTHQPHPE